MVKNVKAILRNPLERGNDEWKIGSFGLYSQEFSVLCWFFTLPPVLKSLPQGVGQRAEWIGRLSAGEYHRGLYRSNPPGEPAVLGSVRRLGDSRSHDAAAVKFLFGPEALLASLD